MSSGWAAIALPGSAPSNIARFAPSPDGGIRCAASPRSVTPGTRSRRWPSGRVWIMRATGGGLAIGDQCGEFRSPTVELVTTVR